MTAKTVAAILQTLVHHLSGPARAAFALYVRQALVYGWEDLAGAALLLGFGAVGGRLALRAWRRAAADDGYMDEWWVGLGIVAVLAVFIGVIAVFSAIPWLLNPQWAALQMLLGRPG